MRVFAGLLLAVAGCTDPPIITGTLTDPDAGPRDAAKPSEDLGTPDAGNRWAPAAQLHPAIEESSGSGRILRGRVGAHTVQTATSAKYRLRGGFRPLSR